MPVTRKQVYSEIISPSTTRATKAHAVQLLQSSRLAPGMLEKEKKAAKKVKKKYKKI